MGLKTRIVMVVLAAAAIPILAMLLLERATTDDASARSDLDVMPIVSALRGRYEADRGAVERLCDAEAGTADLDDARISLAARAQRLSFLAVMNESRVVAATDEHALTAQDRAAASSAGDRWFLTQDGKMLLTGCAQAGHFVLGGRSVDEALAGLTGPGARVSLGIDGSAGPDAQNVWSIPSAQGSDVPIVVAVVEPPRQGSSLPLLLVIAASLGVALVLGTRLARRIASPLGAIEAAASRVALGDLDSSIGLRAAGEGGRAIDAFNKMTHELRMAQRRALRAERLAAWRDIAQRIAHEIKNPLSPIQMSIETLRKTRAQRHPEFDEIFEESTVTILEEVERLKHIVSEFSRFARLPRPRPTELDVYEVASHVATLLGNAFAIEPARTPLPRIRADREQLTQVLVNLTQNAIDAAHEKQGDAARIVVSLWPVERTVRVVVDDNGPGVPADQRARIFEPYVTNKRTGTGLGLAIVHRIVVEHGGTIEVDDSQLGGARFTITLPIEGPPPEAEASMTESPLR